MHNAEGIEILIEVIGWREGYSINSSVLMVSFHRFTYENEIEFIKDTLFFNS